MKALILAAGMGTRLSPITDSCPKSLVPVNGKPILDKQLENLYENGIREITVIAGYKHDVLKSHVNTLFPEVNIIFNRDYATTNNMFSAYLGRQFVEGSDFLMMNADVFFDSSVISSLLNHGAENAIVTDIGNYLEESMKVTEENGRITGISKQISKKDALGSSIDVYKFSESAGSAFFKKCHEYIVVKKELNLWSEVALNDILREVQFEACPLVGRWTEIDDHSDLRTAEELFSEYRHNS
ncbi:MAG TPA: phosphocholine cytidylyltransferase family protein [Clostridiales bacterium]|jgi:choline kinase|nr:phosphocholine cytidylyltransferase family protein [Clostridiales bacterium]